jgi:hypothetical protein
MPTAKDDGRSHPALPDDRIGEVPIRSGAVGGPNKMKGEFGRARSVALPKSAEKSEEKPDTKAK